jgi:hypothetical protein
MQGRKIIPKKKSLKPINPFDNFLQKVTSPYKDKI